MDSLLPFPFDETQDLDRSPSRLDFCMEDGKQGDDPRIHRADWPSATPLDPSPYPFVEEDFAVDIAPLDTPVVDSPQGTAYENTGGSDSPTTSSITVPQAPTPVRPPSLQRRAHAQEPTPHRVVQRLNYPHHGLSRSALLQQKTLWNSRQEEWAEWQSCVEQNQQISTKNDAYTGIAIPQQRVVYNPPPYMRSPPSGLERDLVDPPPRKHEDVPPSIYPRVGDISALRDPYSVNIDRCFFRYPLWTLQKALYAFNMHLNDPPAPSASVSASTLRSDALSSDDEALDLAKTRSSSRTQHDPPPPWSRLGRWELSWYARWELLIGLFQRDRAKNDPEVSVKTPSLERKGSPPKPPHRFTVEVEDDEDDEDYGTIIPNSFRVDLEEECERAMAFYNRHPRRSKTAS